MRPMFLLFIIFLFLFIQIQKSFTLPTYLKGDVKIIEEFYIDNPKNIKSIEFYIPFQQHFSNISFNKCEGCYYFYNGTQIKIKVKREILHEGINKIILKGKITQHLILPYKGRADKKYVVATSNIQSNLNMIKDISSELMKECKGDKRCFVIKSVEWVNKYLTYDATYSNKNYNTSWILENRRGVCAEYTTLFISLMRNKGIPSKYNSVLVYDMNEHSTIPHAYAEVYLNGTWYPVDVLWKQVGYVDALHIYRGSSIDNQIKNKINVSYQDKIDFKWINERIEISNVSLIKKDYFRIDNKTINIQPGKNESIILQLYKNKKVSDGCVYIEINPCLGGNITIFPLKQIACNNISFNVFIKNKNVVCPLVIQYDNKYTIVNITTSSTIINYKDYEKKASSFLDLLRKFLKKIIWFIKSL